MSKPRVVSIVQARLGGTRLPGKVLLRVAGQTLLDRHISRLRRVAALDAIVVAIPAGEENAPLAAYCDGKGWPLVRGSETDVLARFYNAALAHDADVIVRTTPDCPLIDPGVVAGAINLYLGGQFDYVSNNLERTFPHGLDVEVFGIDALEAAHEQSTDAFEREHVSEWIRRHQDRPYRLGNLRYPIEDAPAPYQRILREARLTVDYPEDLLAVKAILEFWEDETRFVTTADVLWLLNKVPDIMELNRARAVEHAQLLSGAFEPLSIEGRAEISSLTREAIEETKH